MDHAKKFVLIPEQQHFKAVDTKLSQLDQIMNNILKKSGLDDSQKAVLYHQALQKYLNVANHSIKTEEPIIKSYDLDEKIINTVPQKQRKKIRDVIHKMKKNNHRIFWNEKGNAVIIDTELKDTNPHDCRKLSNYPVNKEL